VKRILLVLADLLRADLSEFSAAIERDDLDAAAGKLEDISGRVNEAVAELRG
jgi:hypothetical protein